METASTANSTDFESGRTESRGQAGGKRAGQRGQVERLLSVRYVHRLSQDRFRLLVSMVNFYTGLAGRLLSSTSIKIPAMKLQNRRVHTPRPVCL